MDMTPNLIARDIIHDYHFSGKTIRKDDVSPEVWTAICAQLEGHKHWTELSLNGEIQAWEYISMETMMDDDVNNVYELPTETPGRGINN